MPIAHMEQTQTIVETSDAKMAEQFSAISIPHSILQIIPYQIAVEYFVLPYGLDEKGRVRVLMAYPGDAESLQRIQFHTGNLIRPLQVSKDVALRLITKHYGALATPEKTAETTLSPAKDRLVFNQLTSTIGIVNDIIHEAVRLRASDIHFEPFEREMLVRFRIDGVLQEMMCIPKERILEVTSRIKIMSRLNIAEKRRSQDGRIRISENGKDVDIRVSSMPTDFGEKIVLQQLTIVYKKARMLICRVRHPSTPTPSSETG